MRSGTLRRLRDRFEGSPAGRSGSWFGPGMGKRAAVATALAVVAAWGLLHAPVAEAIPVPLRLGLALFVLVMGPGYAVVALGAVPPGGLALAPTWALAFGILIDAALLAGAGFGRGALDRFEQAWPVATAALWLAVLVRPADRDASRPETLAAAPAALAAVLLAAALAAVHAGLLGTPVTYYSDSPDHIGTIRRIVESGDPFPNDAFFKDAGALGSDPRKGIWHALVALVARLARVDAADAWIGLSASIAPWFALNAAALGWLAWGPAGAAVTAWMLLVLWGGNLHWVPLRKAVFGTFLGDQLALATAVALLWDVERRRRVTRAAAALLAAAAVATHVYAAMQFAIAFPVLLAGLALREGGIRDHTRRARGTLVAMAVSSAVALSTRLAMLHPATNVIHTEPQGLFALPFGLRVVSPGVVWDWLPGVWPLFVLLAPWMWRHRWNPVALYALATAVGVALVIFNPLAVAALEPRVGYLLMRTVWMLPAAGMLGWALVALARAVRARRGAARLAPAAGFVVLVLWLAPAAVDAWSTFARPGAFRAAELARSPLRWREPLAWLDRHLPPGQVVLSDPATSYGVPMLTRHYVATLVDQHSSPSDSLALTRLLDARDALDPWSDWSRTRDALRRHRVTVIVLNRRFDEIPGLQYWAPSPAWFDAARARLDARPDAFERVRDDGDFVVYRVNPAGLDTLQGPAPPRPYVVPYAPGRFAVARRVGEAAPLLQGFRIGPPVAAPGDTLTGVAAWRVAAPLPAGAWSVPVRFDRDLPDGISPPPWIAKPVRKLVERWRGERYRFREDHLPVAGAYGVDLWRPDQVVRDSFAIRVPHDAAPGVYRVQVKMIRQPHYPNYAWTDYLLDQDYYAGVTVANITLRRRTPGEGR